MATTTVVPTQEVDAVIAYQERIEQQREQADREQGSFSLGNRA